MSPYVRLRKWRGLLVAACFIVCVSVTGAESWTPQGFDGQWQVYSPGWSYMWLSAGNYAVWRNDAIGWGRFVYDYAHPQWFDGSWNKIGTTGASSDFLGDGAWHNLSNGWSYLYATAGDYAGWMNNGLGKLRFISSYSQGQWYDGAWNKVGIHGTSTAFIGDGAWHNVSNGWSFSYINSGDYAGWMNNGLGQLRFISSYSQGQWFDGTWNRIGAGGTSTAFIGDGAWHNVSNGWSYLYTTAGDYAGWMNNGLGQLRFISVYSQGQWFDGTWNRIGAGGTSTAFMGDGAWHSLNNGWSYVYNTSGDYGRWKFGANQRFEYSYRDGQWFHSGANDAGVWRALSGTGLSSSFLGDGAWHDISQAGGNTWWYRYSSADEEGVWAKTNGGQNVFRYGYSGGQWWNFDFNGDPNTLGAAGIGSQFVGDGAITPHNLGNGWGYRYAAGNIDEFYLAGLRRFTYDASTGVWTDYARMGLPQQLGVAGLSGAFIGDGSEHDLGNGFGYLFDGAYGYWLVSSAAKFAYLYDAGQWFDYDECCNRFALGTAGLSAEFIGNGSFHDLGNGWYYSYDGASGYWFGTGAFSYLYSLGEWSHYDAVGDPYVLGTGLTGAFIGDGGLHDLGNGFGYRFDGAYGYWLACGLNKFSYLYADGQWFDYDRNGNSFRLGVADLSGEFVGDGGLYDLGNGFSYQYDGLVAHWLQAGVDERFQYDYANAVWSHLDKFANVYQLGSDGLSAAFVGDGLRHDLGNGFAYAYDGSQGFWLQSGINKFSYAYATGQWSDWDVYGNSLLLGNVDRTAQFIGDGSEHDLGNGFGYLFDGAYGYWLVSSAAKFAYLYDAGQWFDYDTYGNRFALGNAGLSAEFIGNGSSHTLGNGWAYSYDGTYGYWSRGTVGPVRFSYGYALGQWYQHYAGTGYELGALGQDGQFRGDGTRYQVAGGATPWHYGYDYALDRGTWQTSATGSARFSYAYTDGRWYHFDEWGAHALGPASVLPSSFMGSAARYDITTGANTWWYSYDYAGDRGQWATSETGLVRFSYGYGNGQWYHHEDLAGNAGYTLGFAGRSVTDFIGSGDLYQVSSGPNNAWWYRYTYAGDYGDWHQSASDNFQFRYLYGLGQWLHAGYSGPEQTLGQAGTSLASFIGDGSYHVITPTGADEWRYRFDYVSDQGYWNRSDKGDRFSYAYDTGQWYQWSFWDHGSPIGHSQNYVDVFFGDDGWHWAGTMIASGDAWFYQYDYLSDTGSWSRDGGPTYPVRFSYDYTYGRWYDHPAYGAVYQLGADVRSSEFLGYETTMDLGTWHGRQWWYTYAYDANEGSWAINTDGSGTRFSYAYDTGQWYHHDAFGPYARYALGGPGMLADEFMGANAWRDVTVTAGINWWYLYDAASDFGLWSRNGTTSRFSYDYANGAWWDEFTGFSSTRYQLSADGTAAQFVADGTYRPLGLWNNGSWWYKYKYIEDEGWWARDTTASGTRFSFAYATGQWYHHDAFSPYSRAVIGAAGADPAYFIGSGDWRNVGYMLSSWIWNYQYSYADDAAAWSVTDTASNRLRYTYSNGTWAFWERGDRWVTISDVNRSVQNFIGYNGSWHYLWDSTIAGWQFNMDLSSRFVIRSTWNTTLQYLGYNFASTRWMDGGSGYALANITAGTSPYWLNEVTGRIFDLLSSNGRWEMQVAPSSLWASVNPEWVTVYYDVWNLRRPYYIYTNEFNAWYRNQGGTSPGNSAIWGGIAGSGPDYFRP